MSLQRLKWLTAALVVGFMLAFEYARHFVWAALLHTWPAYLLSVAAVVVLTLVFNQAVFGMLERMQQRLLQQNRRLSVLNAMSATVSQSLDLDETLNDAIDKVVDLMGVDAVAIHLLEEDRLPLKFFRNLPPHFTKEVSKWRVGEGLSGRVAESGQPIVVQEGFSRDPRLSSETVRQQGFESFACVPLLSKRKVVGVLSLATYQQRKFRAEDLELLTAIGNQIGVAVESAGLHAQVQQQANYLNTLIESSGNAIITVEPGGRVLSWNRGAELIYGWSKEEAIGQVIPMVPDHLQTEAYRLIDQVVRTGKPMYNIETHRQRKDDELIPVMVTVSPIRAVNGKLAGLLGISTDMRDKKRLEQELFRQQRALAVLKERERLARELHDSLGQILGYVNTQTQAARELLSRGQTTAADTYLGRLAEVAQDAHADVREYILSLQAGALAEQGFLPALEDYLQRFSRHHGIQAELMVSGEQVDVAFDPDIEAQLMRIIQEALTNVMKHARARHVWIALEVDSGQAQVAIEDDGCGFDPARISLEDGWHFGLRIMRERAEEFGGGIQVQSRLDQGTKVMVKIPLRRERGDEEWRR